MTIPRPRVFEIIDQELGGLIHCYYLLVLEKTMDESNDLTDKAINDTVNEIMKEQEGEKIGN